MRTLVLSDLHLGSLSHSDVLRRPQARARLIERLRDVDRVVLLGDTLELRHGSQQAAVDAAAPILREIGAALGSEREIVYVAGNHDWMALRPWLDARAQAGEPLGLAEQAEPAAAGALAQRLEELLAPARMRVAYPGIWLRDDVYATHGHYLDLHTTVPTVERIAAGTMRRFVAPPRGRPRTPGDYEAALAPLYAWIHEVAQGTARGGANVMAASGGASTGVWLRLRRDPRRHPTSAALYGAVWAGIAALNRIGIGPLSLDLSGVGLRRGGLRGIGRALDELGVRAPYAVFGHSHRAGPFADDDEQEWRSPGGVRLVNTGSWVYARAFLAARPDDSPYWPGTVVLVEDEGPPRIERLLDGFTHEQLAPPELDDEADGRPSAAGPISPRARVRARSR